MDSKSIHLKRVPADTDSTFDAAKCIICQESTSQEPITNEQSRKRLQEAASVREDIVLKRLKLTDGDNFVYHMSNDCYKRYTLRKSLERVEQLKALNPLQQTDTYEPSSNTSKVHCTRSNLSQRAAPSTGTNIYKLPCVICGHIKHKNIYEKYRISECDRATKFLQAAVYFQDDVFVRSCDLQDVEAVFGADIYYHANCLSGYLIRYDRQANLSDTFQRNRSQKMQVFAAVLGEIDPRLKNAEGFALSDIRDHANELLKDNEQLCASFTNRETKILLLCHYGENISFSFPKEVNKSAMVFMKSSTAKKW